MTLLKDDGTAPEKLHKFYVTNWPDNKQISKYGWYFGIGFGLAVVIAVPFILLVSGLFIVIILAIFGSIG